MRLDAINWLGYATDKVYSHKITFIGVLFFGQLKYNILLVPMQTDDACFMTNLFFGTGSVSIYIKQ